MDAFLILVAAFVILQRLVELRIANRNGKYIVQRGGREIGVDHYKWFIGLHTAFFVSLLTEGLTSHQAAPFWWPLSFAVFVLAQGLRIWCIRSLGPFWNTRIYVVPGMEPVTRGPYRYLRHPNYMVVTLELLFLPLTFGCFRTAFVFTLLNALLLRKRIPIEEAALQHALRMDWTRADPSGQEPV